MTVDESAAEERAPTSPRDRGGWRRVLRIGYLVVVAAAFVIAVAARRDEVGDVLARTDSVPLTAAIVLGLTGVGVSGLVWRRMLAGLGAPLPPGPALRVFFVAQIGKYLPGSLWPVVAQAELGADHGVPRRSAVAAQSLFMWVHLVTGAVLGIPALAVADVLPAWAAPLSVLLLVLLLPGPLGASLDWLLRRLRRQPLPVRPRGADMLVATGWALLMWLCYGLHTHLLVDAFQVVDGTLPVVVTTGAFAAAWSAGFVFLIAPAGAGAREVVLIAGLGSVTDSETALTVALLSRLLLTLADGLWAGVGLLAGVGRGPGGRVRAPAPEPPVERGGSS